VLLVRYVLNFYIILRHMDPLLGGDREADNGTSGPRTTREVLFYMWSASRLYHTTDRVSAVQLSEVKGFGPHGDSSGVRR
jgi:hypothetical protein